MGPALPVLLFLGTALVASQSDFRANRTARQVRYPDSFQFPNIPNVHQYPNGHQFSNGFPLPQSYKKPASLPGLPQFYGNLPSDFQPGAPMTPQNSFFPYQKPFSNSPLAHPGLPSYGRHPRPFDAYQIPSQRPQLYPARPSPFGFPMEHLHRPQLEPVLPSPLLSPGAPVKQPFNPYSHFSRPLQSSLEPSQSSVIMEPLDPILSTNKNVIPWPQFQGIKRVALGALCHGRQTVALGKCSSTYLRCSQDGQHYSFEECAMGQVFFNGHCRAAYAECFNMHMYRLSVETQYLMQDSHFCLQGEGAYIASSNQCSRQAVICKDFNVGFAISCTHESIISPTNLQCVPSPLVCSPSSIPPEQFAPWKFALINYHCTALTHTSSFFSSYAQFSCRSWYVDCRATVREIITCDAGQIYDHQSQRCRLPTRGDHCFMPPVTCSGRNWYSISLGHCQSEFARCEGGLTKRYMCSEGFVFSEGQCLHPSFTNGMCPVCSSGQTTQFSYQNCNQYSICKSGRWVQQTCRNGWAYARRHRTCVNNHSCASAVVGCQSGSQIRISCGEYMECSWDGQYRRKRCPLFHSWDTSRRQCVYDMTCRSAVTASCSDGQIIESWDCRFYFQCSSGQWHRLPCGDSFDTEGCRRCSEGFYQQQVGMQIECIDGMTRHDFKECSYFGRCQGGRWVRQQCMEGLFWNQQHGQCMETSDCPQFRRSECLDRERIASYDGVRCDGYFECIQGSWMMFNCGQGKVFDATLNECAVSDEGCAGVGPLPTFPIIRPPMTPPTAIGPINYFPEQSLTNIRAATGCELGSFIADDFDCRRYLTCTPSGLIPSACLPGMAFNPRKKLCDRSYQCDFTSCIDGQMRPGKECGEFKKCEHGQWLSGKCPDNQYFEAGRCHPSFGKCGALPHSSCFNNQVFAAENDCSSYLLCQDGLLQRRHCQGGDFFDPAAGHCSSSYHCPFCSPNQMKPCEDDCRAYSVCISGHFERKSCPEHHYFDAVSSKCIIGSCERETDSLQKCMESAGPSGYRPHPISRHKFQQCAHGSWVSKDCPANLMWNQKVLTCDWPRNVL